MDLDSYCRSLVAEGVAFDSGHFTLDPKKALEKLRRFQLQHPCAYPSALLGAAFWARAPEVNIEIRPRYFEFSWERVQVNKQDLCSVLEHLINQRSPQHLRQLGLAVNAACGLSPRRLTLESGGHLQEFTSRGPGKSGNSEVEGLRFRVEHSIWQTGKRSLQGHLEENYVRQTGFLAAPILRVNGEVLSLPLPPSPTFVTLYLKGGPRDAQTLLQRRYPRAATHLELESPGAFGGVLALGAERDSRIFLLNGGLAYHLNLEFPGVFGLIVAPRLKSDLSTLKLVEDPLRMEIVSTLLEILNSQRQKLVDSILTWDCGNMQEGAQLCLDTAFEELAAGNRQAAIKILKHLSQGLRGSGDWNYFEAPLTLWALHCWEMDYYWREFFEQIRQECQRLLKIEVSTSATSTPPGRFVILSGHRHPYAARMVQVVKRIAPEFT